VRVWQALWRAGSVLAVTIVVGWAVAVVGYDPWRRGRVLTAMRPGSTWPNAILQAENAASPDREEFVAFCMAANGPAAEFRRGSSGTYSIVQNGREEPDGQFTRRVRTSEEHFRNRARWSKAVSDLGQRLRCGSLSVIWPPTYQLVADLDAAGRLIQVSTASVDAD
jgi:hypothetical protein